MSVVGLVLFYLLTVFLVVLIARFILELVLGYNPSMRPAGALVVFFEIVYTVTDPPLRLLRRLIPPLRIGSVSLDLSILLLMLAVSILQGEARAL